MAELILFMLGSLAIMIIGATILWLAGFLIGHFLRWADDLI